MLKAVIALGCCGGVLTLGCASRPAQAPRPVSPRQDEDLLAKFPSRMEHTIVVRRQVGGWASVKDSQGYVVELSIPPLAVADSTSLTLAAGGAANPLDSLRGPMFRITASVPRLLRAASVRVHAPKDAASLAHYRLFETAPPGRLIPLARQSVEGQTLRAGVRHFSSFAVGMPSQRQLELEAGNASPPPVNDASAAVERMRDLLDAAEPMMEWAGLAQMLGADRVATGLHENLSNAVDREAEAVLREGTPADPCGPYLETLLEFGRLVGLLSVTEVQDRFKRYAEETLGRCPATGQVDLRFRDLDAFDPECGSVHVDVSWTPAWVYPFNQQGTTLVGGAEPRSGSGIFAFTCGGEVGRVVIALDVDVRWGGKIVIADPFEVRIEFDIVQNERSGGVTFEGGGGFGGAFWVQQSPGTMTMAIPVYRDEMGVLRGWVQNVQVEQDRTRLQFDYADGAQAEIVSPDAGVIAYYVLTLAKSRP